MYRLFAALLVAALPLLARPAAAEPLVWTGVDYGLVRMIGTADFRDPAAIFPGYLDRWNALVLYEQLDNISKRLHKQVVAEVSYLGPLHALADPDTQIVRNDLVSTSETHLSAEVVAGRVRTYDLSSHGTALVFVADQLNKPAQTGCYWVTYFDLDTRAVHSTDRRCGGARGFGFRNYWFGTVKAVIRTLRKDEVP